MSEPYLKIEISKSLKDEKEVIEYFILKDDLYGIKISKNMDNNLNNNEEIIINNVFDSEEETKKVIDSLVNQGNDFSQIQYVVEDYKKMFKQV